MQSPLTHTIASSEPIVVKSELAQQTSDLGMLSVSSRILMFPRVSGTQHLKNGQLSEGYLSLNTLLISAVLSTNGVLGIGPAFSLDQSTLLIQLTYAAKRAGS